MNGRWIFALVGVGIGVVLGFAGRLLWDGPPGADGPPQAETEAAPAESSIPEAPPEPLVEELERLQQALAAEFEARALVEGEVVWLRQEVEELREAAREVASARRDARRRSFDEEALRAAGIEPEQARRLRVRFEEFEEKRNEILDREIQDDGVLSNTGVAELFVTEQRLKFEVGDEDYDAILYATGRDNRLVVREVRPDSPAREAGIEPGDVVLRYGNRRVFAPLELRQATRMAGGETVEVELLRGDQRMQIFVPSGWLGVTVDTTRQAP